MVELVTLLASSAGPISIGGSAAREACGPGRRARAVEPAPRDVTRAARPTGALVPSWTPLRTAQPSLPSESAGRRPRRAAARDPHDVGPRLGAGGGRDAALTGGSPTRAATCTAAEPGTAGCAGRPDVVASQWTGVTL